MIERKQLAFKVVQSGGTYLRQKFGKQLQTKIKPDSSEDGESWRPGSRELIASNGFVHCEVINLIRRR